MSLGILHELMALGVEVIPRGENLVIRPASRVPADLKERLKASKPEILAALRRRPATCATSCYEIEPGKWIHRAWDGCVTGQKWVI
jgi:hypothetical protein